MLTIKVQASTLKDPLLGPNVLKLQPAGNGNRSRPSLVYTARRATIDSNWLLSPIQSWISGYHRLPWHDLYVRLATLIYNNKVGAVVT
jgi:hypothetical protein